MKIDFLQSGTHVFDRNQRSFVSEGDSSQAQRQSKIHEASSSVGRPIKRTKLGAKRARFDVHGQYGCHELHESSLICLIRVVLFLDERVVFGREGLDPRIDLVDGVSDGGGAKMGEAGRR